MPTQTRNRLFQRKFPNDTHILAVDGHGVTNAFVVQNLNAALAGTFPAILGIERQDGAQLFTGVGVVLTYRGLVRQQNPCVLSLSSAGYGM